MARSAGTIPWARVVVEPDGRGARVVGVTVDVTERVRLEAQLRQAQKM
jgi:hypothetical protein